MRVNAMLKSALLVTTGIVIGVGALQVLKAAEGPAVYNVYEATVKDEATYAKALTGEVNGINVEKAIKENGGVRVAGGFNKAKVLDGKPEVGNRYVIIKWPNEAAITKWEANSGKAWIEKNQPDARNIMVQGVE
jgi:heme-degrading monooxygenase HmoA